jgi:phosphoglycerate dehydrogenase-like enzyme
VKIAKRNPLSGYNQKMHNSGKVVCLRQKKDFEEFNARAPSHFETHYLRPDDKDMISIAQDADVLMIPAVGPKISNKVFSQTSIKFVQVTGAGIDRLDRQFCLKQGITVCNVQGGSAFAVAEFCLSAAIVLSRKLNLGNAAIGTGNYAEIRQRMIAEKMLSLQGQTVGIVGFGTIGRETARLFKLMGCRVVCYDIAPPQKGHNYPSDVKMCELSELLKISDIVSIHVPLLDETANLISKKELSMMKPLGILINAARGGIVDECALAEALESNRIRGAVLDVFSQEPPSIDSPLLNLSKNALEKVIFTPHIAGVTAQAWTELFTKSWSNIQSYFDGGAITDRQI